MSSTKANPSIISIGLPPHDPLVPAKVQDEVESSLEQTKHDAAAVGVDFLQCNITPDHMEQLTTDLKSRQWDGVVIGNGVRSNMELTHFMEKIIVTQQQLAPQARLMFNVGPDTILEAVRRWFPNVKQQ